MILKDVFLGGFSDLSLRALGSCTNFGNSCGRGFTRRRVSLVKGRVATGVESEFLGAIF